MRKNVPAFSLLEILVVVVVIGIMATMAFPRLTRKAPKAEWETILDEVNNLVDYARQEAISQQKIYRLNFHSVATAASTIQVEQENINPEKPNQKVYTIVKSYYFNPRYTLPEQVDIVAVYHGKKDDFEEYKNHGYCYVIPNGLVQETYVHMKKTETTTAGETSSDKTLRMAPFLGRFELLDGFVKYGK